MRRGRHLRGFTLIEVLIAAAILAMISAGLLVSTWRLVNFADDEVDLLAAAMLCEDVWEAARHMDFASLDAAHTYGEVKVDPTRFMPYLKTRDLLGRENIVYPTWRSKNTSKKPSFRIKVLKSTSTSRTISITAYWYGRNFFNVGKRITYSPDNGKGRLVGY